MTILKKLLNKTLLIFGIFIVGLAGVQLFNRVEANEESEQHYIIGMDQTMAPFTFLDDNGNPAGLELEIFDAIAEEQGISYEYQNLSFSAGLQALETKQIDGLLAGVAITPDRAEVIDFSDPILEVGNQFAVRADSPYESIDDLRGATIAVKTGSTGFEIIQDMQEEYDFEILPFDQSVNMHNALTNGNAEAAVESSAVQAFAISTGQVDFRQIDEVINPVDQAFATNAGPDSELLTKFNEGLLNLQESGRFDEILDSYLGAEADAESTGVATTPRAIARSLGNGLWTTIWVAFVSILIATVIGLIFGLMRVSSNRIIKLIADIYIYAMRGVPMIVFSFFIYFGVAQWLNTNFSPAIAGIAALSINTGAYIAEIVRGGIQGVPRGQMEAGRSLGMNYSLTMRKIILPQALKAMIPSLVNQFILALKNTSVLSVIGMVELTTAGQIIIARTYQSGNIWLIVGTVYIVLITVLTKLSEYMESRLNVSSASGEIKKEVFKGEAS